MSADIFPLLTKMLNQLDGIERSEGVTTTSILKLIDIVAAAITTLKNEYSGHTFIDQATEITFYKSVKPEFDSRLIYYLRLLTLISREPPGDIENIRMFYKQELQRVRDYFEANQDFYLYHRLGYTHLDPYYFVKREGPAMFVTDDYLQPYDMPLSTAMSHKLAIIRAYELLQDYISRQLWIPTTESLKQTISSSLPDDKLTWTGPKAALVELIVALQEYGVFNNTKVALSKIANYFSQVFQVELGNIYKVHEDNRLRKKNRTVFLDALRLSYLRRLDHEDETSP